MNIVVKQLRTNPFEIKKSTKNLKKTYRMQLAMATIQDVADDESLDGVSVLKRQMELQDTIVNYTVDMLGLSEKETDKLEELEFDEVVDISLYISMRVTGMSDKEIEESRAEEDKGLDQAQPSK
ncbi:hypothetical protein WOSG25_020150 [Weissella oryzae SG25]|uniref:Phage tail protein n=1 Tax=Weissella oryzae (strain DSM 25784 / JCM 18191 / LMG 30913 / SG25) TaxID=1329250 RepID=A0A069CR51_WEIOS|nr:phage tail tube assembly chaperone [Weissella oryzae]GAK30220.1 hypothetical protein WOSG25_020150 [Weissella oryzae SG25]